MNMSIPPLTTIQQQRRYDMFIEEATGIAESYGIDVEIVLLAAYLLYAPSSESSKRVGSLFDWREAELFLQHWFLEKRINFDELKIVKRNVSPMRIILRDTEEA